MSHCEHHYYKTRASQPYLATLNLIKTNMTGFATTTIHGADHLPGVADVVQPIHISTNFKYSENPEALKKAIDFTVEDLENNVYSRCGHSNSKAVEEIVGKLLGGNAVVYNSGLSALFAAVVGLNPKKVALNHGYHGCRGVLNLFTRVGGAEIFDLDNIDQLGKGDLVVLETPVNPDGTVSDIQKYADLAHKQGALLLVDSTFAPPPLQYPFNQGADVIMHSATKFFGGHSDLLAGILVLKSKELQNKLLIDRMYLGTIIGSLEANLLVRSLRTFELRVVRQVENAKKIVDFLVENKDSLPDLASVTHGSLQTEEFIKTQMPNGHSPVFTFKAKSEQIAKSIPSKLKFFHHATSLGGVESLIEWRVMSDDTASPLLLRVSVGVENVEDLIGDLKAALGGK